MFGRRFQSQRYNDWARSDGRGVRCAAELFSHLVVFLLEMTVLGVPAVSAPQERTRCSGRCGFSDSEEPDRPREDGPEGLWRGGRRRPSVGGTGSK